MKDRPAVLFVTGLALSLLALCFAVPESGMYFFTLTVAAASAVCALLVRRGRISSRALIFYIGMTAGAALWIFNMSFSYYPAQSYAGHAAEIRAEVLESPDVYDDYSIITARLTRLGSFETQHVKIRIYLDGDRSGLRAGDVITVRARLSIPENTWDFDRVTWLRSDRIYLSATTELEPEITRPSSPPLWAWPSIIADACREKIGALFGKMSGWAAALTLGDKSGLSDGEITSLRRAGLSHIIAVSGMHLSFLVGVILFFMRRRAGVLTAIPVTVLYILVTGASPSVVRAGIMQIIYLLSFVFSREADSKNSLFIACGLMLIVNPFAIADAALWMSACSTMGIILLSRRMAGAALRRIAPKTALHRVLSIPAGLLSTTVASQIFVLPVQMVVFGELSLVAPISNLAVVWAAQLAFTAAVLSVPVSFVFMPAGRVAAGIASVFLKYMRWAAEKLASLPYASVSTDNAPAVCFFVIAYLTAIICVYMSKRGGWLNIRRSTAIISTAFALCVCAGVYGIYGFTKIDVVNTCSGQSVIAAQSSECVVVGCGGSNEYYAQSVMDALFDFYINKVNLFIIPSYRQADAGNAETLMQSVEIERILLPLPNGEKETARAEEIEAAAEKMNIDAEYLDKPETLDYSGLEVIAAPNLSEGTGYGRILVYAGTVQESVLAPGPMPSEEAVRLMDENGIRGAGILAAGDWYATHEIPDEMLSCGARECVISAYREPDGEFLVKIENAGIKRVMTQRSQVLEWKACRLCSITDLFLNFHRKSVKNSIEIAADVG